MPNQLTIKKLRHVVPLVQRVVKGVDSINAYLVPRVAAQESMETPDAIVRPTVLKGMWLLLIIFGFFGLWSALAPIKSAAIAAGQIVLDSNRKKIQHLEGGIIAEIFVREGDMVKENGPLVRLDDTAAKARLDLYRSQSIAARALVARLLAERDNKESIEFPDDLVKERDSNPIAQENLDSQSRLFKTRRKNLDGTLAVLNQKVEQFKEEISGLESQKKSTDRQIQLLEDELVGVRKLEKEGLALKARVLGLERNKSALAGELGELVSEISKAQQAIAETEISMINQKNEFLNDTVAELKEAQTKVADLEEHMRTSADMVSRIVIHSPIAGQVTGLKVHTVGGVIAPGEALMEIVPQDDKLIVEVKVRTDDIDVVRPDLEAQVRLSAYRARYVPPLKGKVVYVSADSFTDERTGIPFYTARVEVDLDEIEALDQDVKLYPGMPAETLIVTGARSFLNYLIDPIRASMNRAFREQ